MFLSTFNLRKTLAMSGIAAVEMQVSIDAKKVSLLARGSSRATSASLSLDLEEVEKVELVMQKLSLIYFREDAKMEWGVSQRVCERLPIAVEEAERTHKQKYERELREELTAVRAEVKRYSDNVKQIGQRLGLVERDLMYEDDFDQRLRLTDCICESGQFDYVNKRNELRAFSKALSNEHKSLTDFLYKQSPKAGHYGEYFEPRRFRTFENAKGLQRIFQYMHKNTQCLSAASMSPATVELIKETYGIKLDEFDWEKVQREMADVVNREENYMRTGEECQRHQDDVVKVEEQLDWVMKVLSTIQMFVLQQKNRAPNLPL